MESISLSIILTSVKEKHKMQKVRVVQNPISEKMLVILETGMINDLAVKASEVSKNKPECDVEASCDGGAVIVNFTAEERKAMGGVTATDFYERILEARGMSNDKTSNVFDIEKSSASNKLQAVYKEDRYNEFQSIQFSALEAARLSRAYGRENEGVAPVIEFEYRGKKIAVDGKTEPADIEATFPENERQRAYYVYVAPRYHAQSVKDQFNVVATEHGITAEYKNAEKNDMYIYYIANDLINLSREYNDVTVQFTLNGHDLCVTSADSTKEIEKGFLLLQETQTPKASFKN
jgi:hypothetical protein